MIADEACAERGCPMHDYRLGPGVQMVKKEWVGLTESERRLIDYQWQDSNRTAIELIDLVEAKLKEKNMNPITNLAGLNENEKNIANAILEKGKSIPQPAIEVNLSRTYGGKHVYQPMPNGEMKLVGFGGELKEKNT